jgi:hypothetical protein
LGADGVGAGRDDDDGEGSRYRSVDDPTDGELFVNAIMAAVEHVKRLPMVDAEKVAVVGSVHADLYLWLCSMETGEGDGRW